jgi:hypothetical protein
VSANKAGFDLREMDPLSRNILHSQDLQTLVVTGRRTDQKISTGHRGWLFASTSPKDSAEYLIYPADGRDSAKSGLGHCATRHLNYLVASISVNVGGSYQNAKESSPLMSGKSVGGPIVVRGWKSPLHGEGGQFVGISNANSNRM